MKNLYQSNLQKALDKDKSFEEVSSKVKKTLENLLKTLLYWISNFPIRRILSKIESSFHEIDISLLDQFILKSF